jgi:biopolymer transport protein ExbD
MGMSVKAGSGGGGFSAEPNVVPMIDILLVLLIIFMMQVSLTRQKMDVQLPPKQEVHSSESNPSSNQIVLELLEDGSYAINSEAVALGNLDQRIHEIYDTRPAKLMFIKTAGNRSYGDVVAAMDIARGAGVQVVGFTPPELKQETEGA